MTWLTWIAARPDGELFVVADSAGRLRFWSPAENRVVARHVLPSRLRRAEWTCDGLHVVAIDESETLHVFSGDGTRREASIATGHKSTYGLSVHPSRMLAATTGDDGHVRVWDLATEKAILDVTEPSSGTVTALSEKHVAAGWQSGHFVAWDLESGKDLAGGEIFSGYVASMAFSNDGVSLVCGGSRGSLVAIQSTDWTASAVWKGTPPKPISTNAIAFEPRSSRFVCAHSDDTASVFASTGDRAPSRLGYAFYVDKKPWSEDYIVSCACFVPSAPLILTSHFTGRLEAWLQEPNGLIMPAATITFDDDTDAPAIVPRFRGPIGDPAAWWAEKSGRTARKSVPQIDLSLRERVLAEFATSAASATDAAGLGRAASRIPHASGITPRSKAGGMTLDFAPPIPTASLSTFLGWNADLLRGPSSRPRIGMWLVTLPEGTGSSDAIAQLHLALGGAERTRYLGGRDPWEAPKAASSDAIVGIVGRVLAESGPPSTVSALERALSIAVDAAALAVSTMGKLTIAPQGSIVMNVSARYAWSPYSEGPVTKIDDLRGRDVSEWTATFSEGFDTLAAALRDRFGSPRVRLDHHVYSTWILGGRTGHPCTLAFHAKLPDWAVEPPDSALRARALRDLADAVASAGDGVAVTRAAAAIPPGAGLVPSAERRDGAQHGPVEIELVPAIPAAELAAVLGWQSPAAQTFARLQDDWHLRLVTGKKDHVPETALPSFGRYGVFAALDGRPTGGPLPGAIGGPPGGTHLFGPNDVVRFLRILV